MGYEIICPYCFGQKDGKQGTFRDDQVMFRSERFHKGENPFLPAGYSSVEDVERRYQVRDKEEILEKCHEWEFFLEREDEKYKEFWDKHGGVTTEDNAADKVLGIKAYMRKIIDPGNPEHQKYLEQQEDGGYVIRDMQGMVSQIRLKTGEVCMRRVCPYCHNPLPEDYGKTEPKFVTLVGITNSGKTVFLSQLLRGMEEYATKTGLAAHVTSPGVLSFLRKNEINVKKKLPDSTPKDQLQQPLFYELVASLNGGEKKTSTFVMYDVPGEIFDPDKIDTVLIESYAPYISRADGIVFLIDPRQLKCVGGMEGQKSAPITALRNIRKIVTRGDVQKKCSIPIAVCVSKMDCQEIQGVLENALQQELVNDVEPVKNSSGVIQKQFNGEAYNRLLRELQKFMEADDSFVTAMKGDFKNYSYFAFTALGCEVEEREDGSYPKGPIIPKRLEEPILWLFYQLGYIGTNEKLINPGADPVLCPICKDNGNVEELDVPEELILKKGLFGIGKETIMVTHCCRKCGHKFRLEEK